MHTHLLPGWPFHLRAAPFYHLRKHSPRITENLEASQDATIHHSLTLLSPHLSSKLVSVFRALESQEIDIFEKQTRVCYAKTKSNQASRGQKIFGRGVTTVDEKNSWFLLCLFIHEHLR